MPPAPKKSREVHQRAADLYADHTVSTRTPLSTLCERVAERIDGADAPEQVLASQRDAVLKLLKRAYPAGNRPHALWQAVLDRAQLPPTEPEHLVLDKRKQAELKHELDQGDPRFAAVAATLDQARHTPDPVEREALLADAADLLTDLTPPADEPLPTPGTPQAEDLRAFYDQLNRHWVRVFELALGDTGKPSLSAQTLGQRAVRAGHHSVTRRAELRKGLPIRFGERGWGPRQLDVHLPQHGRWVAALAVLETLRATGEQRDDNPRSGTSDGTTGGTSLADRILARTRKVAARDLHVPAETLNDSELLTQAGWTLLRAGRRHLASDLARSAWDVTTSAATGTRRSTPPDELLELAIELAGVQYSHGEHSAAAATLHPDLCAVLDGPYPGPPDEDWGEVVSAVFYHQFRTTLVNPHEGAEQLRTEWVQALGCGWSTAYPSKWVLAGATAEALATIGDTTSAATVAHVSGTRLESPLTPAEEQLRAHLSEMCSSDAAAAGADTGKRIDLLLTELVALAVREPDAVDHDARRLLEGLQELTSLRGCRIRAQRHDVA